MRNANKYRIAELNHEGVTLLKEYEQKLKGIPERVGALLNSANQEEDFNPLMLYVQSVREIKGKFLAYQKNRQEASFLDTDM